MFNNGSNLRIKTIFTPKKKDNKWKYYNFKKDFDRKNVWKQIAFEIEHFSSI